jgi:hypothetical protein
MAAGLTDRVWTVAELLRHRVAAAPPPRRARDPVPLPTAAPPRAAAA